MTTPTPETLAAAGIVLDATGKASRRRWSMTVNAHRRTFARKSERDDAAAFELTRQARMRDAAEGPADFAQVFAQESAKRGMEIAAAGGHVVLLFGPPGSAKAMLRNRMASIGGAAGQVLTGTRPDRPAEMYIQMRPTDPVDMALPPPAERSAVIGDRVTAAQNLLALSPDRAIAYNGLALLREASERMTLTTADEETICRVARTIAALDSFDHEGGTVRRVHIAEALSYFTSWVFRHTYQDDVEVTP